MEINRISIIGISGSGKSFLAIDLANHTKLPLFHMDKLFWRGNWQEVPEAEYLQEHQELIKQDAWIIEGYIDAKMADRLQWSDLVIFLDYSGWLCAIRVFLRWFKHREESRPELPKEAKEKLKGEFLWRVLVRKERVPLQEALNLVTSSKLIVAKSPLELKALTKQYFQFE